jgi:hypothetical protein
MAEDEFRIAEAREEGYSDSEIIDYLYKTWRLEEDVNRLKSVEVAASRARGIGDNSDAAMLSQEAERLSARIDKTKEALKNDSANPSEAGTWWNVRVEDFEISSDVAATIEKELPRMEREAFLDHVTEVLSITAYFIGGFWLFSFVIGWIVRGFAGIPRGLDFRPNSQSMPDAKMTEGA